MILCTCNIFSVTSVLLETFHSNCIYHSGVCCVKLALFALGLRGSRVRNKKIVDIAGIRTPDPLVGDDLIASRRELLYCGVALLFRWQHILYNSRSIANVHWHILIREKARGAIVQKMIKQSCYQNIAAEHIRPTRNKRVWKREYNTIISVSRSMQENILAGGRIELVE